MSYSDHDPPPRGTVRPREPVTPTRSNTHADNGALVPITPLQSRDSPRSTPPKKRRTNGQPAQTYSDATRTAPPDPPPVTEPTPPQSPSNDNPFAVVPKGIEVYMLTALLTQQKRTPPDLNLRKSLLTYLEATRRAARLQYLMLKEFGWPEDEYAPMENFEAFIQSRASGPGAPTTPAITPAPTATPTPHQTPSSDASAESCTPPPPPKPTTPLPSTAGPRPSGTQKPRAPPLAGDKQGSASATRSPTSCHKKRARTDTRPVQVRPARQRPHAHPSTRLLVNIAGSAKVLQPNRPHPARLRDSLNSALPTPMVASTSFASSGQLVIHTAQPHTAQQLAVHHATLWPAIRSAFGLAPDMASPELEPDDTWSKVVISNVPLPVASGHVDVHTVQQEVLTDICRSNGIPPSSVRRARWLCSDEEALRRASSSSEASPTFVAVMIAMSDHKQASSLRTHGAVSMGAHCRVSAYRPRTRF